MKATSNFGTLGWMVLLSLSLGIFISYFFVFVNALFISEIGTSKLPLAYVFSGIGGTIITWLFNTAEKKIGFAKSATYFCLFFALVMLSLWLLYKKEIAVYYLIFFSYAWFWVSINFTSLVFWKLPSNIFDLSQNKKYNGIISTGEVVSAIIAYLSVPALLSLEGFSRDKLLLISFLGILGFSFISSVLGRNIKLSPEKKPQSASKYPKIGSIQIYKEKYFQLIFLSVFLAVIIQLLIDFSLMEVSAYQMSDAEELAKFFAFLFGGMRLLELILKSFLSKFLLKEYGVFISLSTLIFALGFIVLVGLSSLFIGYAGLILIVASLSKLFERSLYRSIYAPTINVLYQAYPITKRALTQNYADGFGKTVGQLIAALLIFMISQVSGFEPKVFFLLLSIFIILIFWLILSKKLIFHYKLELSNILASLQDYQINEQDEKGNGYSNRKKVYKGKDQTEVWDNLSAHQLGPMIDGLIQAESVQIIVKGQESLPKERQAIERERQTLSLVNSIKSCSKNTLLRLQMEVQEKMEKQNGESLLLPLIDLFIQVCLLKNTPNFNFFHFNKQLLATDFLLRALIKHSVVESAIKFKEQDYLFLLEERVRKYAYLQACKADIAMDGTFLHHFLEVEAISTRNDLLLVLSLKYDTKSLNRITRLLQQDDRSEKLIALELLELLLKEQEKKWVLPIFRGENPESILRKLESDFPQNYLGEEKRLLSILANHDMDIPSIIQTQAMIELFGKYPIEKYQVLSKAFINSPKFLLRHWCNWHNQNTKKGGPIELQEAFYKKYLGIWPGGLEWQKSKDNLAHIYWGEKNQQHSPASMGKIDTCYGIIYEEIFLEPLG